MIAEALFAFLGSHASAFGVPVPEGDEAVFWNAYFRELHGYKAEALEHAMAAWKDEATHGKSPLQASIFPTPAQLARLAKEWRPPAEPKPPMFDQLPEPFKLPPLPDFMRPRLSPSEVAAQLRAMEAPAVEDDIGVVL